jgi:hypothetical protein
MLEEIQDKHFSDLRSAKFKCIFDTKMCKRKNRVVLASIRKTGPLLRHLTAEEAKSEEGFDYILKIDQKVWENTDEKDKTRLLMHELCHTFVDDEAKDPYKIIPHDYEDFISQIKLNADDPDWANRVCSLISDIYDQEKENSGKKRGRPRKNL